MADQGAAASSISASFLEKLEKNVIFVSFRGLGLNQIYRIRSDDFILTFQLSFKPNLLLQIGHGTNMISRNIIWKDTEEELETRITGHSILESAVCYNCESLIAPHVTVGEEIDVK